MEKEITYKVKASRPLIGIPVFFSKQAAHDHAQKMGLKNGEYSIKRLERDIPDPGIYDPTIDPLA